MTTHREALDQCVRALEPFANITDRWTIDAADFPDHCKAAREALAAAQEAIREETKGPWSEPAPMTGTFKPMREMTLREKLEYDYKVRKIDPKK